MGIIANKSERYTAEGKAKQMGLGRSCEQNDRQQMNHYDYGLEAKI